MFTFGFYDSLNGDRRYTAEQMSAIFDGLIGDGIFATIGNVFDVTPGNGLRVIVDEGKAWFNHTWNVNDSKMPLSLAAADVTLPRIDAVVLDINSDSNVRTNSIQVIKGTPSSSPQKPTLIKDDIAEHWQYAFAYVTVPANATSISLSNIEKVVGKEDCPFVTGILQTVDISLLFTNWQGTFEDWFTHIKIELSGDVAGNLQNQIDEINDQLILMTQDLGILELTLLTSSGHPLVGVPISGLYSSPSGSISAITDSKGVAKGYAAKGNLNVSISGYLDIEDKSQVIQIQSGIRQKAMMTVNTRNFYKITATKNDCKFSGNVSTIDVTVVGGGGGGGSATTGQYYDASSRDYITSRYAGGGGGGGYVTVKTNIIPVPNKLYPAIIGAGGAGASYTYGSSNSVTGNNGSNGGATSFIDVTASGGNGGSCISQSTAQSGSYNTRASGGAGAGAGGFGYAYGMYSIGNTVFTNYSTNGSNGLSGYDSFSTTMLYGGGGGGGGASKNNDYGLGGETGGGNGGYGGYSLAPGVGTANTGGGGGGGSNAPTGANIAVYKGGAGGSGVVTIRMHLKVS